VALDRPTQFSVSAVDSVTGTPVTGIVFADGVALGATNTPIATTLRTKTTREFDPDTKRWVVTKERPLVTVRATGYPEIDVDLL
jgi:hypothetical protein